MKLALLAFLFLLFNSSTADEVVLDAAGEPVQSGGDYYMERFIWPGPGGVSLANISNKACPVDVIAVPCCLNCIPPTENCNGEALRFTPREGSDVIKTNHQLSIAFAKTPSCAQSSQWILVKEEGAWLVGIGGPEDHPGKEILTGWFIIERSAAFYTLKFCPKFLPLICGYLGLYVDANQNWRLRLTDGFPHMVFFRKADEGSSVI